MQKSCQIICSFEKKQYLCIAIKQRAFSSAGSEHLPYKQRVGGSNPSTPTKPKTRLLKSGLFLSHIPTKKPQSMAKRFSGRFLGIDYALLPNRQWNQKQKHKKNSLGAKWNASHLAVRLCALRHWKRVSMPPTTQSLRHPLTRAHHIAPRIKTARRFTAKNP